MKVGYGAIFLLEPMSRSRCRVLYERPEFEALPMEAIDTEALIQPQRTQ